MEPSTGQLREDQAVRQEAIAVGNSTYLDVQSHRGCERSNTTTMLVLGRKFGKGVGQSVGGGVAGGRLFISTSCHHATGKRPSLIVVRKIQGRGEDEQVDVCCSIYRGREGELASRGSRDGARNGAPRKCVLAFVTPCVVPDWPPGGGGRVAPWMSGINPFLSAGPSRPRGNSWKPHTERAVAHRT